MFINFEAHYYTKIEEIINYNQIDPMTIHKIFIVLLAGSFLLFSCGRNKEKIDLSEIDPEIEIERFEREMFEMNTDTLTQAISYFYKRIKNSF